jgi:hypothetical protein
MRGHFLHLRFKTFPMTPRTPQCEVFWAFLSSSEHSGVSKDSKSSLFPSVGLHPHTWPKWGCDNQVFENVKGQIFNLTCSMKNLLEIQTLRCIFFIKIYSNETNECMILKLIQTFYPKICNLQIFILNCQKMLLKTQYFEQIKLNIFTQFFN